MTDEINVLSRTQVIIVEPTSSSVSVINAGPQGPAGPPGVMSFEALVVTGSKGDNEAIASLITALASLGLVTDATT